MEKLKILVVDDESRMRKLVKDFLVKAGYDVIEAGDGEQAVDTFYAQKDIALIILDVMMPKMDGWQVCREIRQNSKVPIIMLTAKSEERDELLGFELGVDEYISILPENPRRPRRSHPAPQRQNRRRRRIRSRRHPHRQSRPHGIH